VHATARKERRASNHASRRLLALAGRADTAGRRRRTERTRLCARRVFGLRCGGMYVPLSRVLLRAPLLPVRALARARRALLANPLGALALELASPSLAASKPGPARDRAVDRYARRAAFRSTPSGLLAGVCLGKLGPKTDVGTGAPAARLAPSWARLDALARALLEEPEIRERVRLRTSPSALRGARTVQWVGPGDPFDEVRAAELDGGLATILAATEHWRPWPEVRTLVCGGGDAAAAGDADELLSLLVDDGLLQTDLAPPLIGSAPGERLRDRLAAIGRAGEARMLGRALRALRGGELPRGREILATLPGGGGRDLQSVLVHRPARTPQLERAAVERAARLVPLLVGLQEALAPPAAERFAPRPIADALDGATELYGAGAFDLGALARGEYGVELDDGDDAPPAANPPPALLVLLHDAFAEAARRRQVEIQIAPEALARALGGGPPPPLPATAELFVVPMARRRGEAPGTGWLLGLHAPAGASFGRYLHALGPPLGRACQEIAAAESRAHPDRETLDVAFAPSAELADLCAHPKIRDRTLALTRWTDAADDLTVADLELCADPALPAALALRTRAEGRPIVPSPLARVRSSTAPAGAVRLLVGWSLQRQHAPWAFVPGPLADLGFIPRLVLDGFVIAPASWRLPPEVVAGGRGALARWRRAARAPRFVQVGEGDQLLAVDLSAPEALVDLGAVAGRPGAGRIFEIWPPLASVVDRDGRRVEVVVAVVDRDPPAGPDLRAHRRVPPPSQAPPLPGWRTFKLFGAAAHQDELLQAAVVPAIERARAAREIDAWFFLRYLDGPGRRPHLRLRVHAVGTTHAFEDRLRAALGPARAAGAVTALEMGDYHPEWGRFAADELPALHAIFESDSAAAASLLAEPELEPALLLTRAFDALASGLGLDPGQRHALALERRAAAESWTDAGEGRRREADAEFRRCGRALRAALGGETTDHAQGGGDRAATVLEQHRAQVAAAVRELPPADRRRLAPTLLHLCAVRWTGTDADLERLAYTLWERTLEGLDRQARRRPRPIPRRKARPR
jgi:thiopeptide-type bacteriocin biosynthesis protein